MIGTMAAIRFLVDITYIYIYWFIYEYIYIYTYIYIYVYVNICIYIYIYKLFKEKNETFHFVKYFGKAFINIYKFINITY